MGTLNSYNFGIVEGKYKLFSPNRGFSGLRNRMVSIIQIYHRLSLVATATNRSYFNIKLAIARLK